MMEQSFLLIKNQQQSRHYTAEHMVGTEFCSGWFRAAGRWATCLGFAVANFLNDMRIENTHNLEKTIRIHGRRLFTILYFPCVVSE